MKAPMISLDALDACNDKIRRARTLTVLTLTTLQADDVYVEDARPGAIPEENFLTEAVIDGLEEVRDTLRELHDYLNGLKRQKEGVRP